MKFDFRISKENLEVIKRKGLFADELFWESAIRIMDEHMKRPKELKEIEVRMPESHSEYPEAVHAADFVMDNCGDEEEKETWNMFIAAVNAVISLQLQLPQDTKEEQETNSYKEKIEERLTLEWGLISGKSILERIFIDYREGDTCYDLLSPAEKMIACASAIGKITVDEKMELEDIKSFIIELRSKVSLRAVRDRMLNLKVTLKKLYAKNKNIKTFHEVIDIILEYIFNGSDYKEFVEFIDAIIGYHNYYKEQKHHEE